MKRWFKRRQPVPEQPAKPGVGDLVEVSLSPSDFCYDEYHGMVGFIAYADDHGGYGIVPRNGGLRAEESELKILRKATPTV